jgi:hypothetical protein
VTSVIQIVVWMFFFSSSNCEDLVRKLRPSSKPTYKNLTLTKSHINKSGERGGHKPLLPVWFRCASGPVLSAIPCIS